MATTTRALSVATAALVLSFAAAMDTIQLGHHFANACREARATIDWDLPEDLSGADIVQLYFISKPEPKNLTPEEKLVMSKYGNDTWEVNTESKRFLKRLYANSIGSFTFDNSLIYDRGRFRLYISTPRAYYNGTIDFMVYSQDNLFPVASSDNATSEEGDFHYTYQFTQPQYSPAYGVNMTPVSGGGGRQADTKPCTFPDRTTQDSCTVDFTMGDLAGMSGSVEFDVQVMYVADTPQCNLDHRYSFFVTIVQPKESPLGKIVASVGAPAALVVLLACVVPVIVIKYNKRKNQRILLEKGLKFVEFCTKIIENYGENWRVLEGIYRANKAEAQTQRFIEVFQKKNGNLGKDYNEEQALMAAAIKMFLKKEPTPWIPTQLQRDISNETKTFSTDEKCNVGNIRELLYDDSNAKARARANILRHLMRHFNWVVQQQREILQQVREETRNDKAMIDLVDINGIATILSPNFFKEAITDYNNTVNPDMPQADKIMEGMAINARQIAFITLLIVHAPEIFPRDDRTIVEITKTENKAFDKENGAQDPMPV